jgi:hypothetical protein
MHTGGALLARLGPRTGWPSPNCSAALPSSLQSAAILLPQPLPHSCPVSPPHPTPALPACPVQYDEDELPSYESKSSHLKGRDAWLVERVTREFTTAYPQASHTEGTHCCWLLLAAVTLRLLFCAVL